MWTKVHLSTVSTNDNNNNNYNNKKEGKKMKFTIEKNTLLESLNNVTKAISIKNVIPVLNGIKFELSNEGLYLTASDTDLTIKSFIEKDKIKSVERTGSIVIQSKYINEIIRKLPDDTVDIEVIEGLKVLIKAKTSHFSLNCLKVEDYPQIKLEYQKDPIVIKGSLFKTIIKQTVFAISSQESRPLLTGINFKLQGNIMEITATDSYRLAKKTITLQEFIKDEINITIPGNNISELDKIINDDEPVEMHIFSNKILFIYKNITFQSNLLSGTYPNTNNLIPDNFSTIFNTNYDEFYSAIDRASLLTQSKEKNIVKMETKDNVLVISSFASEIGRTEETIAIEKNEGDNVGISFSAKYMMDALKTIDDTELVVFLNSEIKPIVIKSAKDETLVQLILPIKTY